jgi:polyisoprenyl-phosphate glycosyltransferase
VTTPRPPLVNEVSSKRAGDLASARSAIRCATQVASDSSSQSPTLDVSVIVPVYRNAGTLRELRDRLSQVLEGQALAFELLFVDDASPDGSLALLRELAAADQRVAVLALAQNVGQHRAVIAGLGMARGEWSVVLDADLQDPPEAIPTLLASGRDGYAAVFAGRRGRYESRGRLFTSWVFKRLLSALCGVPPDAGIFVAMHCSLVERLLEMGGGKPFVVAMIGCAGLPMASVPVPRDCRHDGESAYSAWGRLRSGWRGVAYALSWHWHAFRRASQPRLPSVPVRAYVGTRFAPGKS